MIKNHYIAVHLWMRDNFTKTGICEFCNSPAKTEWSNKSGEYRKERDDWQELCRKCHKRYDMAHPEMRGASLSAGAHIRVDAETYALLEKIANVETDKLKVKVSIPGAVKLAALKYKLDKEK